jgi:hypothetical protein
MRNRALPPVQSARAEEARRHCSIGFSGFSKSLSDGSGKGVSLLSRDVDQANEVAAGILGD